MGAAGELASLREDYLNQVQRDFLSRTARGRSTPPANAARHAMRRVRLCQQPINRAVTDVPSAEHILDLFESLRMGGKQAAQGREPFPCSAPQRGRRGAKRVGKCGVLLLDEDRRQRGGLQ